MEEHQSQQMDNITQAIMQYIDMRTDYAVMLTGEWGSGKTFYVNNVLKKEIEKHEDYKPIVISLFGVGSTEEINTKILMETLPILSENKIQVGSQIGKIALRGAMNLLRLGDLEKYTGELGAISDKLTKHNKLVLFFDDFERRGNISLTELTGYINALVEDKSSKVIIVANESEISELKEEAEKSKPSDYQPLKEKLVQSTFLFDPDFSASLQEIMDAKYGSDYQTYRLFLDNHKELINRRFVEEAKIKNLRTLSFALEVFCYVFSSVYNWNKSEKKYEVDQLEKYLREMFLFTLAICIEYRKGAFQNADPNGIESETSLAALNASIFRLDKEEESEANKNDDFALSFRKKYYQNDRYLYFQSLFDFIVGKGPFKTGKAMNEIKVLVERNTENPEWQTYYRAQSQDYFDLSNDELKQLYRELLNYTVQGLYSLDDTLSASSFLVWMARILGENLDELTEKLKTGIVASFSNFGKDDSIELRYSIGNYDQIVKKLIQFSVEQNNAVKGEEYQTEIAGLNRLIDKDFDKFLEEIQNDKYGYEPILSHIDASTFNKAYRRLAIDNSNPSLNEFLKFIRRRYKLPQSDLLAQEKEFFVSFQESLTNLISETQLLTTVILESTQEIVSNIISNGTSRQN